MILAPLRVKPWLGLVLVGFVVVGVLAGWFVFPAQWGASMKVAAGVALGVGSTLSLYLPRMIATDFDD